MAMRADQRMTFLTAILISAGGGILASVIAGVCLVLTTSVNYWAVLSLSQLLLPIAGSFLLGFIGVFEWVFMMYVQERRG